MKRLCEVITDHTKDRLDPTISFVGWLEVQHHRKRWRYTRRPMPKYRKKGPGRANSLILTADTLMPATWKCDRVMPEDSIFWTWEQWHDQY